MFVSKVGIVFYLFETSDYLGGVQTRFDRRRSPRPKTIHDLYLERNARVEV